MNETRRKWLLELVWWFFSILLAGILLLPIHLAEIQFEWLLYNFFFIIGGVTIARYIFGLKYHPLARSRVFKTILILIVPLLFFPILEGIHSFLEFNDREGLQSIMDHLSIKSQNWFIQYIRIEYIFFAVSCMLGVFALIIKMIRSLWRQYRFNEI